MQNDGKSERMSTMNTDSDFVRLVQLIHSMTPEQRQEFVRVAREIIAAEKQKETRDQK